MNNTINEKTNIVNAAFEKIEEYAASPCSGTRMIQDIAVGQCIRQGDVYLTRLAENFSLSNYKVIQKGGERQVVEGNTRGSNHIAVGFDAIYDTTDTGRKAQRSGKGYAYMGPVIVASDRFSLVHPEHADFSLPSGVYRVSCQVDLKTMQQVRD